MSSIGNDANLQTQIATFKTIRGRSAYDRCYHRTITDKNTYGHPELVSGPHQTGMEAMQRLLLSEWGAETSSA